MGYPVKGLSIFDSCLGPLVGSGLNQQFCQRPDESGPSGYDHCVTVQIVEVLQWLDQPVVPVTRSRQ